MKTENSKLTPMTYPVI